MLIEIIRIFCRKFCDLLLYKALFWANLEDNTSIINLFIYRLPSKHLNSDFKNSETNTQRLCESINPLKICH